jgi:hypothetical protein
VAQHSSRIGCLTFRELNQGMLLQAIESSRQLSESAFHILRTFVGFAVFFGAVAISRWGIRRFVLERGRISNRSSKFYPSVLWSGLSESNRHLNLGKVRVVKSNALERRHLAFFGRASIGK